METTTNVATLTTDELERHIAALEQSHRTYMRALRALLRVRREEDAAT
jgi:hypothetical protein